MWRNICSIFIVTTTLLAGCNKDSDNSTIPPVPDTPMPVGVKARPTTQQLQDRVKLDLKYDPLTVMVPASWELKSMADGSLILLSGYTPHDMVGISLPVPRIITSDRNVPADIKVKNLEAQARADAARYPELVKGELVRKIDGAEVIEHIIVDPSLSASTQATTQTAGAASTDNVRTMQWIITVCVPSGADYKAYELRFLGLTVNMYQTDQDFLRSIINTISYNPPPPDMLGK